MFESSFPACGLLFRTPYPIIMNQEGPEALTEGTKKPPIPRFLCLLAPATTLCVVASFVNRSFLSHCFCLRFHKAVPVWCFPQWTAPPSFQGTQTWTCQRRADAGRSSSSSSRHRHLASGIPIVNDLQSSPRLQAISNLRHHPCLPHISDSTVPRPHGPIRHIDC